MACYKPLHGYRARKATKNGKYGITFNIDESHGQEMQVPCGQCIGCRLDNSRQWAVRICHEAQLHDQACFVTLTYDDEHIPQFGELRLTDFQKFMKRLRKRFGSGIRYFHCGEYGDQTNRPHYHAILFGWEPTDKVLHKMENETPLYLSADLMETWRLGFTTVGNVTFESAAYVARYTMKKLTGNREFAPDPAHDFFSTGALIEMQPPYATMSRRPGIAKKWFEKYKTDVYPDDLINLQGKLCKVPRYYDNLLENTHKEQYDQLKKNRRKAAKLREADNSPARLAVREEIAEAKCNKLVRTL